MNTISAVIITFNEEQNIERCLKSVQKIADEIIVVDSFSTDSTLEICARYGARFIPQQWLGYGKQKNLGNELASSSFILSIDADEALSEALQSSILDVKASERPTDSYSVNRLNSYCGRKWIRHSGWYPDTKIRLWKKGKARWDYAEVHESLMMDEETTVGCLKGDLLHYTYHTISDHIKTADKYATLSAQKYFVSHKKSNTAKIIAKPLLSFIRDYIFRLGILDGYYGFVVCAINAFGTFLKYVKLKELQKGTPDHT